MNDSPAVRVDLFADLMAQVDDPFGDHKLALAGADLDAEGYESLVASWRARFDRDASGQLAGRFADAYAERRTRRAQQRRREASGEVPPADPRFLNAEALSFREEAARVGREPNVPPLPLHAVVPLAIQAQAFVPVPPTPPPMVPPPQVVRAPERLAGTTALSAFVPRVALPFAPASMEQQRPSPPPAVPARPRVDTGTRAISAFVPRVGLPFAPGSGDQRPPEPPPAVPAQPRVGSGTTDVGAAVPRHLLPFGERPSPPAPPPPAPVAEAEPRRRLVRFDSQTGQPLPAPMWVDMPPEPGQKK
jgi:hypothetical protein